MNHLLKRAALACALLAPCLLTAAPALADCTTATTPNTLGTTANATYEAIKKLCEAQAGVSGLAPSGMTPVTASFTAVGNTSAFSAIAGRPINVTIDGTATGLSARLTRRFAGGSTWFPITIAGSAYGVWTANVSEQAWVETEYGVDFRVEVTAIGSGTANVRISQ